MHIIPKILEHSTFTDHGKDVNGIGGMEYEVASDKNSTFVRREPETFGTEAAFVLK